MERRETDRFFVEFGEPGTVSIMPGSPMVNLNLIRQIPWRQPCRDLIDG